MYANGHTIIQLIEELAPKHYAVEGDKIGLQLGTLHKEVRKVLIALDVTDAVVDEAIAMGADLIVAHHALIYRPLAKLDFATPAGRLFEKLVKHDIAVYISHTNLDVAAGGMNDWMADLLGLENRECLEDVYTDKLYKLVVFVPLAHQKAVQEAIWHAGAGEIGNYSCCSFVQEGIGTFKPGAGTDPYTGQYGQLTQVEEVRIETIVPHSLKRAVVAAMRKAHPYEEVAYDVYPVELKGSVYGLGRVGRLPSQLSLEQLAEKVKQLFEVPFVRVVGQLDKPIRKAAVLGGSGSRYIRHAQFAGADVLITGDIDYHTAHDALAAGLALIDPGHNSEKVMKPQLAHWLHMRLAERKSATAVLASQINTEPFQLL